MNNSSKSCLSGLLSLHQRPVNNRAVYHIDGAAREGHAVAVIPPKRLPGKHIARGTKKYAKIMEQHNAIMLAKSLIGDSAKI